MRILHVIDTLDQHPGHVSMSLCGMLASLRASGVECDVVAGASHDELFGKTRDEGQTAIVEEDDARAMIDTLAPMARQADVVHVHAPGAEIAKIAAAAARALGKPLVVSSYGEMVKGLGGRSKLSVWFENRRFAKKFATARRVVCHSEGEVRLMRTRGIRAEFGVAPVGFDGDVLASTTAETLEPLELPRGDGARMIAYFGDIDGRLGLVQFFKACDDLEDELEDWRIVVAGRPIGNWLGLFQAGARRHGKEHLGAFVVYPDASQQRAILEAADFVVQPTPLPAPPIAAMWAMWHGKPVLVSDAAGPAEVSEYGAGEVVEPSRKGILRGLERMVASNKEALRAQGEAAQTLVRERLHWSVLIGRYVELYESIAS